MNRTFRALSSRPFRRWTIGSLISATGTWMQLVAQSWLVLDLTGSTTALGATVALQAMPSMVLGLAGGVIADRFSRRAVLLGIQAVSVAISGALAVLTLTGAVEAWMVLIAAVATGACSALEGPSAASVLPDLVEADDLPNAVAVGSATFAIGRVIGLSLAGIVIGLFGPGAAFAVNAVSFAGPIVVLLALRLPPRDVAGMRQPGAMRAGVRHVAGRRDLVLLMVLAFMLASFGRNFQVTMAAMTDGPLGGGAGAYGLCSTAFAIGSFGGALVAAQLRRLGQGVLLVAAGSAGVLQAISGTAPDLVRFVAILVPIAIGAVVIDTALNTQVLLTTDAGLRGRVTSVFGLAGALGAAVGAPTLGWLADHVGPRGALVLGGSVAATSAAVAAVVIARWAIADGRELVTFPGSRLLLGTPV